tara:strand:+ start:3356 stop:4045 length:690 start_codon:yes stop_codon:yes gene_type:complete
MKKNLFDHYDQLNIKLNDISNSLHDKENKFEKIKILFADPIGIYKYENSFTQIEKDFINSATYNKNHSNLISNDNNVIDNLALINVKNFINNSLKDYFKNVFIPKNNVNIYITESWLNKTTEGKYHHIHNHANSIISGVFYFNTIKNDKITFYKDKPNAPYLRIEPQSFNNYNSSLHSINVVKKQLVLFSSNIEHEVPKFNDNDERISLAFNTFVKGDINNTFTTKLKL